MVVFEALVMVSSALCTEMRTQQRALRVYLLPLEAGWGLYFGRNRFKSQLCLADNSASLSLSSWIW